MFLPALIAFALFTLLYGIFSAVVIYHLNHYGPPGGSRRHLITVLYLFASASLLLIGIFSLFLIPR